MRHKSRTEELLQLAKGSRAPVCFPGWKTPESFLKPAGKSVPSSALMEHREIWELWILDSVLLDELLQPQGNVQQGGAEAPWDVLIHHPAWECCTWLKGLD